VTTELDSGIVATGTRHCAVPNARNPGGRQRARNLPRGFCLELRQVGRGLDSSATFGVLVREGTIQVDHLPEAAVTVLEEPSGFHGHSGEKRSDVLVLAEAGDGERYPEPDLARGHPRIRGRIASVAQREREPQLGNGR
jgi:hypothetical protein